MRAYNPIDTTVSRRINVPRGIPPVVQSAPPQTLEGEGLRPSENRDKAYSERNPDSDSVPSTTLPSPFQGFVPTRDFPNPPYMPYSPFPYYTPAPDNDMPMHY